MLPPRASTISLSKAVKPCSARRSGSPGTLSTVSSGWPLITRSDRLSRLSHSALAWTMRCAGSTTSSATGMAANSSAKSGPAAAVMTSCRGAAEPRRVEVGQHRLDHSRIGFLVRAVAELGRAMQAARVPADMLARHVDPGLDAIMVEHRIVMFCDQGILLVDRRVGDAPAGGEPFHHLAEPPGPALGPAPDHHAVRAGLLQRRLCILDRADVAIGDHRTWPHAQPDVQGRGRLGVHPQRQAG